MIPNVVFVSFSAQLSIYIVNDTEVAFCSIQYAYIIPYIYCIVNNNLLFC